MKKPVKNRKKTGILRIEKIVKNEKKRILRACKEQ
jgi:hypothetical protein